MVCHGIAMRCEPAKALRTQSAHGPWWAELLSIEYSNTLASRSMCGARGPIGLLKKLEHIGDVREIN
jgi:hypothetical protein